MRSIRLLTTIFAILCCSLCVVAERGVLVVYVSDVHDKPVSEIEIETRGDGGSASTKSVTKQPSARTVAGKARIPLAPDTKPNALLGLSIARSPRGHEYVLI